MRVGLTAARRLAIQAQGLDGRWKLPKGKEGAGQAVERLGYVQIDTIAIVERAHHHTLWARCPDYTPAMLHELQAADRRVFEYWAKAACCLPMCDYRFYLPRMRAVAASKGGWYYTNEAREITRHVLDRIRAEGPLGSADFKAPAGRKRGSWWDWKPAKRALEWLFDAGQLMVTERRHFQRLYDLTERVLPPDVDTRPPTPDEMARFIVRRALARAGLARAEAVRWGWRRPKTIDGAIAELVDSGEVIPADVEGLDGDHYALASTLETAGRRSRRKRLHILSPFDGLVMDRRRVQALFGFECKLECYLPAAKRRWGYFCLPILWGNEFIGRLDPKADRKAKTLIVRTLLFEPGFEDYDGVLPPLADKLRAFAAFNACDHVAVEQAAPRKVRRPLKRELGT